MKSVWVFHGECAEICTAVFSDKSTADIWIEQNLLSGTVRKLPIDISVYDWVIKEGFFSPKNEHQKSSIFIQTFTSAYIEHYHYTNGKQE